MSDAYRRYQDNYGKATCNGAVAAADTATITGAITAKSALYTIFVQKIEVSVLTDAAKTLTFQDSANTPVAIAVTKSSPGLGPMVPYDFGPEGFPLTQGKNLDVVISGAGLAAKFHVEAYQKLTGVGAA